MMTPLPPYEPMASILPEGKKGNVEVSHFTIDKPTMRMMFHPEEHIEPGTYARLLVNGGVMMSDTPMEKRTNRGLVINAKGDVLIGGLGLGMVLVPVLRKSEVTNVVVIEKNQNVIDLVLPALQEKLPETSKLTVVCADIYDWKPVKGIKFDTIYFDVWKDQSTDDLDDMTKLHRRFARCKKPDGWMESWRRHELKHMRKRENRSGW